jgi:hypothetical protein
MGCSKEVVFSNAVKLPTDETTRALCNDDTCVLYEVYFDKMFAILVKLISHIYINVF